MDRDTVGVLEDKVVGGKGYRVEWTLSSLVPRGEWTEYIKSPTFKLWGIDMGFRIDITQPQKQRQNVLMKIMVIPEDPKGWAKKGKDTDYNLWAKYEQEIFDSRKRKGSIMATSSNVFHLQFTMPLHEETGVPIMRKPFEIKLVVEKPDQCCSLKVAKASLERLQGIRHLSVEMGRLLANPEGSDLRIRCQNQEFPVHKFILSARSTTLKKMMGEMQEDTIELDRVKGRAMTPRAVKGVIEWIYTGVMKDIEDHLAVIIALGEIWGLDELVNCCKQIEDINYRLENSSSEEDEEIQDPPKKKSKTETKDYILFWGDLKVIPWKSRRMEWKVGLPELKRYGEIKDLKSPSVNFFGVDWNLLMSINYNLAHMERAKYLKDFKTVFELSLQPMARRLGLGMIPILKFSLAYDDNGYNHHHNDNESPVWDNSDSGDEEERPVFARPRRVKQINVNKFRFSECSSILKRLFENLGHEIKIYWTLQVDFENGIIADKMRRELNTEKEFLKSLSLDFGDMLVKSGDQDVTLKCEGEDFRAHKIILAAQSQVFKAMLESKMKESLESVVEVKDEHGELVSEDVVGAILRWMYTGEFRELDEGQTLITLGLADFYNLKKLKELCEGKLKGLIKRKNVVDIMLLADLVRAEELKREAIQFILKNKSITVTEDFKERVSWELLSEILVAQ